MSGIIITPNTANAFVNTPSDVVCPRPGEPVTAGVMEVGSVNPPFQALTNDVYFTEAQLSGTISSKAITIDGVGGQTVTTPSGSIVVARKVSGTTTPTTSVAQGELPLSNVAIGWAYINGNGTLGRGSNVFSVSGSGGSYVVTFTPALSDAAHACPIITPRAVATPLVSHITISYSFAVSIVGGHTAVQCAFYNIQADAFQATDFSVVLFGE